MDNNNNTNNQQGNNQTTNTNNRYKIRDEELNNQIKVEMDGYYKKIQSKEEQISKMKKNKAELDKDEKDMSPEMKAIVKERTEQKIEELKQELAQDVAELKANMQDKLNDINNNKDYNVKVNIDKTIDPKVAQKRAIEDMKEEYDNQIAAYKNIVAGYEDEMQNVRKNIYYQNTSVGERIKDSIDYNIVNPVKQTVAKKKVEFDNIKKDFNAKKDKKIESMKKTFSDKAKQIAASLSTTLSTKKEAVYNWIKKVSINSKSLASSGVEQIKKAMKDIETTYTKGKNTVKDGYKEKVKQTKEFIDMVQDDFSGYEMPGTQQFKKLKENISKTKENVKNVIKKDVPSMAKKVKKEITNKKETVKKWAKAGAITTLTLGLGVGVLGVAAIKKAISLTSDKVKDATTFAKHVAGYSKSKIQPVLEDLNDKKNEKMQDLKTASTTKIKNIKTFVNKIDKTTHKWVKTGVIKTVLLSEMGISGVKNAMETASNKVKDAATFAKHVVGYSKSKIQPVIEDLNDKKNEKITVLKEAGTKKIKTISSEINKKKESVKGWVNGVKTNVITLGSNGVNKVKGVIEKGVGAVNAAKNTVITKGTQAVNTAKSKIEKGAEAIHDLAEDIKDKGTTFVDNTKKNINAVKEDFNKYVDEQNRLEEQSKNINEKSSNKEIAEPNRFEEYKKAVDENKLKHMNKRQRKKMIDKNTVKYTAKNKGAIYKDKNYVFLEDAIDINNLNKENDNNKDMSASFDMFK